MKNYRCILAGLALLFAFATQVQAAPVLDQPAPAFTARLLNGQTISSAQLQNKVVILNIWASWCGPCRAEMPVIDAFYKAHRQEGVEVVAISMDDRKDLAEVQKIAGQFSFPIAWKIGSNIDGYGKIWRIPLTFIIDRQGILRRNGFEGSPTVTMDELNRVVLPLLQQKDLKS
ncbi:TlpA disulfide reductase family protein [Limnobacter litoralis]|uniref:Alkyl hydroperoxide reductase n=1 Tax=Limnobacter litoralis TaxID=481366 RepID=A0ABQ5YUA0_9BURK|nr:TlpA disulfide reductase family protein [Limnobacter litoralis]GLR27036.1 alkyl hydroperoxide reductase [Limnobacter litoralis]